ncbi:tripartite tricarboxylate transporter substrate binding protein [Aeromicrobium terrae]|uniref:Tripartite tricarboxylate transporter substrate binding protein n=1 Tax=Aeromicrobium terrae TaxID=2498846 RepID=A0A5C8NJV4_9ACTN|nr:tripartite tricarboxylate transporter substrate binding protein [Aeromicrobium terrae]TXL60723.1 tripartite tricarboxylate transporter substrate binding protein [Aeromicrobium terrae]
MNVIPTAGRARIALVAALTALALLATACGSSDSGSSYPRRDVQVIVPYPAGSGIDTTTRALVDIINDDGDFGHRLQVVNREGGAGSVGTTAILNAKPDGYTIGVVPDGPLTLVPQTEDVSYDPDKLTVLNELIAGPIMFVVPGGSPFKDLGDLVDAAKAHPSSITIGEGPLNYRIPADLLEQKAGVKLKRVKFDGDQATTTALLGKNVDVGVMQLASALPQLSSGKLRALGITSADTVDLVPDVPTFKSQGIDVEWLAYNTLIAPEGLKADVKDKLASTFEKALKSDAFAKAAKKLGLIVSAAPPEEAAKHLKDKAANAKQVLGSSK